MNESADLIFLALIMVFVLYRLYGVLGQNDSSPMQHSKKNNDHIKEIKEAVFENRAFPQKPYYKFDSPIQEKIDDLVKLDKDFGINYFFDGAEQAFEKIIVAFVNGDKIFLQKLLGSELYNAFVSAIDHRQQKNLKLEQSIISFKTIEVTNIDIKADIVNISTKFITQQIYALKDKDGQVKDGSEKEIQTVEDIWIFSKKLNCKQSWRLVQTNV